MSKRIRTSHIRITVGRWALPVTGWGVSLLAHLLLAAVLIIASPAVAPLLRQIPARTAVEAQRDREEIKATVDNLQLEAVDMALTPMVSQPALTAAPELFRAPGMGGNLLAAAPGSGTAIRTVAALPAGGQFQTQFCGARGAAEQICFVVDISGSMVIAHDYVMAELKRSIAALSPAQYFAIVFYGGGEPVEFMPGRLVRAGALRRQEAMAFIDRTTLQRVEGSQQAWLAVTRAMQKAYSLRNQDRIPAQLIYLFTDGDYDHEQVRRAVADMQSRQARPVTLNIIACGSEENMPFLLELARSGNGQARFVTDEELAGGALSGERQEK